MDRPLPVTRRALLGAAAASLVAARIDAESGLVDSAPGVDPVLRERALAAMARHGDALWSRDVVGIADFGLPSATPRFNLIDTLTGTTTTLLVAHGRGSDPDHTGFVQSFSNVEGSQASSAGAYVTGEAYEGVHGPSRRLIGLDPGNDLAEARAIVIHSAWYVGADVVARQGKLGRSDGCFVFSQADIGQVLARLGRGRLIYAGRSSDA